MASPQLLLATVMTIMMMMLISNTRYMPSAARASLIISRSICITDQAY